MKPAGSIPRYRAAVGVGDLLGGPAPVPPAVPGFAVRSASDGLWQVLTALPRPGEVLLPAYTCDRVVQAVRAAGCTPAFADVDPASGLMGPAQAEPALRRRPVAVVATHVFGLACDVAGLRAIVPESCLVIEDCALAEGTAGVGEAGDLALFSHGWGKTVQLGWGGWVQVNRPDRVPAPGSMRARAPRATWSAAGATWLWAVAGAEPLTRARLALTRLARAATGGADRPAAAAAAFHPGALSAGQIRLLERLRHDPARARQLERRRANTQRYRQRLGEGTRTVRPLGAPAAPAEPCGPAFAVRSPRRDALARFLARERTDCVRYFWYSAARLSGDAGCPESERLGAEILGLPNHHGLGPDDVDRVADAVLRWSGGA